MNEDSKNENGLDNAKVNENYGESLEMVDANNANLDVGENPNSLEAYQNSETASENAGMDNTLQLSTQKYKNHTLWILKQP